MTLMSKLYSPWFSNFDQFDSYIIVKVPKSVLGPSQNRSTTNLEEALSLSHSLSHIRVMKQKPY